MTARKTNDAQVGERTRVVRLELQYSLELRARFSHPSFARELRREVVPCIDEVRIAVERPAIFGARFR